MLFELLLYIIIALGYFDACCSHWKLARRAALRELLICLSYFSFILIKLLQ